MRTVRTERGTRELMTEGNNPLGTSRQKASSDRIGLLFVAIFFMVSFVVLDFNL